MGKKSKLKILRKTANQLPVMNTTVTTVEKQIPGLELIKQGVKDVEGQPVNPKAFYNRKSISQRPVNHHKAMKKIYTKAGISGVIEYIDEVRRKCDAQV